MEQPLNPNPSSERRTSRNLLAAILWSLFTVVSVVLMLANGGWPLLVFALIPASFAWNAYMGRSFTAPRNQKVDLSKTFETVTEPEFASFSGNINHHRYQQQMGSPPD